MRFDRWLQTRHQFCAGRAGCGRGPSTTAPAGAPMIKTPAPTTSKTPTMPFGQKTVQVRPWRRTTPVSTPSTARSRTTNPTAARSIAPAR
jgi:hypothetical protein